MVCPDIHATHRSVIHIAMVHAAMIHSLVAHCAALCVAKGIVVRTRQL